MSKSKPLGQGAIDALDAAGADMLAIAHGTSPVRMVTSRARREADPQPETEEQFKVTTVRLTSAQIFAVAEEALNRRRKRGSGKTDSSEIMREALDMWLQQRGRQ